MAFSKNLTTWYSAHKRNLPWRKTKDPYFVWLSEIILQQTQVKQGLPYYISFVEAFPTVFNLAEASEQQVLKRWQGLGYYSRARNLHKTAQKIAHEYDGQFPKSYKELLKLKGIGDYTASAISSICYGEAQAVVDGNVYRVLSRYFGIFTPINTTAGAKEFKLLATKLLDPLNSADHNQALMEFGAIQCKPKNPDCSTCIFMQNCYAFNHDSISNLPVKLKKTKIRRRYFNYLIILDDNKRISIEQRTDNGIWKNLYQFPLIETAKSVDLNQFRSLPQLSEHFDVNDAIVDLFNPDDIIHKLSHQHLYTKFWIIEAKPKTGTQIEIKNVKNYPLPTLISNFVSEFESSN